MDIGVMLTRLTKSDNHNLVKGFGNSKTYSFYKQGETVFYHQIVGEIGSAAINLRRIFEYMPVYYP